jgi:hypothetical protein
MSGPWAKGQMTRFQHSDGLIDLEIIYFFVPRLSKLPRAAEAREKRLSLLMEIYSALARHWKHLLVADSRFAMFGRRYVVFEAVTSEMSHMLNRHGEITRRP